MTDVIDRVKTYQQFIGGEFVDSASGETLDIENPANGQVIAKVPASADEDVDRAVDAADTAFQTWKQTTPQDRSLILLKIADSLEASADELGRLESANAGKPVGAAIDEIAVCADLFRFFAGAARVMDGLAANEFLAGHTSIIRRDPIGVVASIAPWNYPLYMASWKLGPGAGDRQHGRAQAVDPDAAHRPRFAEILAEHLPPGVVNVLSGSGAAIGDDARRPSQGPDGLDHRRHGDRQAGRQDRGGDRQAAPPRARRQGAGRSSSTTPTSTSRPRRSRRPATGTAARTAPPRRASSPGRGSTTTSSRSSPTRSARSSGATRPRRTTSTWARSSRRPRPTRSQGMVDRARVGRRGRRRRRPAGSAGLLLRADDHRRRGPEVRDHPGRDLRPGRHRPAVQRRGAGGRLGERHARTASRRRSSRATSAGRCASPRRSSSATSGSTSTSRSRPRRRTAASSSPARARTARSTRSRTTRSSST